MKISIKLRIYPSMNVQTSRLESTKKKSRYHVQIRLRIETESTANEDVSIHVRRL